MDRKKAAFLTNQTHAYSYALETMRRIAIAVLHISKRIRENFLSVILSLADLFITFLALYRRSILSLCLMVVKCQDYVAADAEQRKIQPSETALLAEAVCKSILTFLGIKNIGSISTTLFRDRQDVAGDPVDRDTLWTHLELFRVLDAWQIHGEVCLYVKGVTSTSALLRCRFLSFRFISHNDNWVSGHEMSTRIRFCLPHALITFYGHEYQEFNTSSNVWNGGHIK